MKSTRVPAALLLASVILVSAGCAQTGKTMNNSPQTSEPEISETERPYADALPDGLNFNGGTVTFLTRNDAGFDCDVSVDEMNGEPLNDAIYERNTAIESRLNLIIKTIKIPGNGSNMQSFYNTVYNSVMAGDGMFDVIAGYQYHMPDFVLAKCLMNVKELPYVDPEASYWVPDIAKKTSINGKIYLLPGDIAVSMYENIVAMLYDKSLADSYKIPDLYSIVSEGNWTLDEAGRLSLGIYNDLNGNGKRDSNDQYGLVLVNGNYVMQAILGLGVELVETDKSGKPEIVAMSEHTVNVFDRLDTLLFKSEDNIGEANFKSIKEGSMTHEKMFFEGRVLFYPCAFSMIGNNFRDMKDDYGIIPLPKYDETQDKYMTGVTDGATLYAIPANLTEKEMTGAVLEAMCAASGNVKELYFEKILKTKYARDEKTLEMIDIIRTGVTYDFGILYNRAFNSKFQLKDYFSAGTQEGFASWFASRESVIGACLDNLLELYSD